MSTKFVSRAPLAAALLFLVGSGCGTGFGGCGTLKPLPAGLTPFGVPNDQVIEGGVQARLTKDGLKKFSKVIENLLTTQLAAQVGCVVKRNEIINSVGDFFGWIVACPNIQPPPACNMPACGAKVIFDSTQRPPPFMGVQDNVNRIDFSMADGNNPILNVDVAFDLDLPINIVYGSPLLGIDPGVCSFDLYTAHYRGDATTKNFHITAPIQLGIDPVTGKLKLTTLPVQIDSLGLQFAVSGCGFLDDIGSLINDLFSAFDSDVGNFLLNLAAVIFQPQIDAFVQGLLPDPLGIAGVVDTAAMLSRFDAPKEAGLEMYLAPGGYVKSKDRGLTLGVLAGMNSDYDPSTRTTGQTSQSNPCVPVRPAPNLGGAPWSLPANAVRKDFTLDAANTFAGMPDPVDMNGNARDLLIGISRTYFDLIGFHLYNSGSLCLHADGSSVSQLSTGTFGVLVPSLLNVARVPKAPLQLVLRPQKPLVFTMGAGTAADALLHIAINDLRIDMYTWVEERWVRILTIGLDLSLGLNLTVTKDAMMNPVIQPMMVGLDTQNLTVRVTNADLLAEPSATLESSISSLLGIAVNALTGSLPTIALPSVSGFSLDDLVVQRVQSGMDDFLGLFATIKTPTTPAPLIDWSDPQHPRLYGELRTHAQVASLKVPGIDQLRALFDVSASATPARPEVRLALSADGASGRPVEYAWKIDDGIWRMWTQNANPVLDEDPFLLQGRHKITVRSRLVGDYKTEDTQPVTLEVLIDSMAPELNPHLDAKDPNRLVFGGWDLVSDSDHLEYAYLDEAGALRPFSKVDGLDLATVGRVTGEGERPLVVSVRDEAGIVGTYPVDVKRYGHGRWGLPVPASTGGCSCEVGGAGGQGGGTGLLALLGALLLVLRSRAGRRLRRPTFRGALKALALLVALGSSGALLVGCGCDRNDQQCRVDDDCAKQKCDAGKIPRCQTNMCVCDFDVVRGDVGRYASMTIIGPTAYVAAYNQTYGDLMIGSIQPPGRVENWEFVDGVPDEAPTTIGSHVRGGVNTAGLDVGKYTSIARTAKNEPIVAYYDASSGALKFASFGAIRWRSHIVDKGTGLPETQGDEVGTWASLTLDKDGVPGIAYAAIVRSNTPSGKPEGQLRYAQASSADPQGSTDWTITVVDSRPLPVAGAMPVVELLPPSIAVMISSARKANGAVGIAYYDRDRGNLRYAEQQAPGGTWTKTILDGETMDGTDTGDAGQFPSLFIDATDTAFIAYVDGAHDNLLFVDSTDKIPVVVDDGFRPGEEMTGDGLPSPVFHLVGDSSSIQVAQGKIIIAYQDSTTLELRLGMRDDAGMWTTQKVAGHDNPFRGAYGFWAGAQVGGRGAYVGSYAINQRKTPIDYYYEIFFVDLGLIE